MGFRKSVVLAAALAFQSVYAGAQTADELATETPPEAAEISATGSPAPQQASSSSTVTVPLPAGCDNKPSAVGLSRIVEIDTSGAPRFGHSQYKDVDFLSDGEVVLTFDDGPLRRYTKPILQALDAHCTRATFFSVGRMAIADPETLQDIAQRGHTVASHTWSHAKLSSLSFAKAKAEIEMGVSAVTRALGRPIAPFFRFPYLRDSKAALDYLGTRGLSAFSIEVDSQDFRTRNPGQVLRTVMTQLKSAKKGIILFHDIQPSTAGALASLLDSLKAGGFKVVHLIAKQGGTTLPEYDAIIDREIEKKRIALAGQPLANRAVTWPNSAGVAVVPEVALGVAASAAKPAGPMKSAKAKATQATPVQPASVDDSLPWMKPLAGGGSGPVEAAGPPPPPAGIPAVRKPKPIWQASDDDPWSIRPFGN